MDADKECGSQDLGTLVETVEESDDGDERDKEKEQEREPRPCPEDSWLQGRKSLGSMHAHLRHDWRDAQSPPCE